MKTEKFEVVLERLAGLDTWLERMGVKAKAYDRIHRAIDVLRVANDGWKKFRDTGEVTKIGNVADYHFGITEAYEFSNIYEAFRESPAEVLQEKLTRAFSGPFRPEEETQRNADGRNTMFELSLGAELRLRGSEVTLGDPDLRFVLGGSPFVIECKRPLAEHSIHSNVRGALRQLQSKLEKGENRAAFGIAAISVSRILNPGTRLFVASSEEGNELLGDRVADLMRGHTDDWAKAADVHERIVGIFFHVATPAAIGKPGEAQDRLVRMTYLTLTPVGKEGPAFGVLRDNLPPLYADDNFRTQN